MQRPVITAVICTRNRADFLRKCIESLLNQTANRDEYEILVVDNGSNDTTSQLLAQYVNTTALRSVYEPVAGLSKARNTGWQHAYGQYVGYIDDDATVDSKWVESVRWVIDKVNPVPDWIGGPIYLDWEEIGPDWIDDELKIPLGYVHWGDTPRRLTNLERLGGGNSVYPKEILEKIGGFDERLGRGANSLLSGEETQLQKRVEASGGYLFYHPGISIYHFVSKERIRPKWFYRRYYWGGISDCFMGKTLAAQNDEAHGVIVDPFHEQMYRVVKNAFFSLGIFSTTTQTVHARVYLSYVLGRISGVFRWHFRKQGEVV